MSQENQPPVQHRGRVATLLWMVQFALSVTLLVIASVTHWHPLWAGIIDVALVFTLVITAAIISREAEGKIAPKTWSVSYRFATYLPVALLLVLWIFQTKFDFNYLTGVAWRTWLLLNTYPAIITVWNKSKDRSS